MTSRSPSSIAEYRYIKTIGNAAAPGQAGNTVAAFGAAAAAGGLVGPVIFGIILDRTGGGQTAASWGWAFATLGVAIFMGALAVRLLSRRGR